MQYDIEYIVILYLILRNSVINTSLPGKEVLITVRYATSCNPKDGVRGGNMCFVAGLSGYDKMDKICAGRGIGTAVADILIRCAVRSCAHLCNI